MEFGQEYFARRRSQNFTTLARGFARWQNIAPLFKSHTRSAQALHSSPQSFTAFQLRRGWDLVRNISLAAARKISRPWLA
ncbi:MAG TPA: hypothetical protein PLW99_03475, partial [Candidatus Paceibacterota bacterium]|nr:hypothetical protein [Candidatus Paceibacterota bacterium]